MICRSATYLDVIRVKFRRCSAETILTCPTFFTQVSLACPCHSFLGTFSHSHRLRVGLEMHSHPAYLSAVLHTNTSEATLIIEVVPNTLALKRKYRTRMCGSVVNIVVTCRLLSHLHEESVTCALRPPQWQGQKFSHRMHSYCRRHWVSLFISRNEGLKAACLCAWYLPLKLGTSITISRML